MIRALLISVSLLAAAGPALAQPSADQMEAETQSIEASMAAAQAAAARPGDEQLTCEALQAEMNVTMNDPAMQAQLAQMGAQAQGQMDQANAARGQMMGMMGMSLFTGLASSFIPGAGYAQSLAMRAQSQAMQSQADANVASRLEMARNVEGMMPQIMRGQRIYELAQARQCPFLNDPNAPPAQ
jgi:hypothetical protein